MANEIDLTASLSIFKPSVMSSRIGRSAVLQFGMELKYWIEHTITVDTVATPIPLGQVSQPHWSYFKNLDTTNYIRIRNGSAGADLILLQPGEVAFFPMYPSATPFAVANALPCDLEYLIASL